MYVSYRLRMRFGTAFRDFLSPGGEAAQLGANWPPDGPHWTGPMGPIAPVEAAGARKHHAPSDSTSPIYFLLREAGRAGRSHTYSRHFGLMPYLPVSPASR